MSRRPCARSNRSSRRSRTSSATFLRCASRSPPVSARPDSWARSSPIYIWRTGIDNFFVLAPNLTIYNKLIADFTPNTPKYVFKGIAEFATHPPEIITGDNYEAARGDALRSDACAARSTSSTSRRSTARSAAARSPRIKRLSEYIGESYFEYLAELDGPGAAHGRVASLSGVGRRAGDQRVEADPGPGTDGYPAGRGRAAAQCHSRT